MAAGRAALALCALLDLSWVGVGRAGLVLYAVYLYGSNPPPPEKPIRFKAEAKPASAGAHAGAHADLADEELTSHDK